MSNGYFIKRSKKYQNKVGFVNSRKLLHDNSKELVSVMKNLDIINNISSIFEIGSGGCRNLKYISDENNNIKMYCNDLVKEDSLNNCSIDIKDKINFIEGDTLQVLNKFNKHIDAYLSSDHLVHLKREKAIKVIEKIVSNKPKYIILRELAAEKQKIRKEKELQYNNYNFNKLLDKDYTEIFFKWSDQAVNHWFIKVFKHK